MKICNDRFQTQDDFRKLRERMYLTSFCYRVEAERNAIVLLYPWVHPFVFMRSLSLSLSHLFLLLCLYDDRIRIFSIASIADLVNADRATFFVYNSFENVLVR